MKQYAKIYIDCTSRKKADKQVYKEFKERMKKYLIDEDMELYRVPILSEDYQYAHELTKIYKEDDTIEDIEECPGLYITENSWLETDYTKKDYEQAVAYMVNFWYLVYPYENDYDKKIFGTCCDNPNWNYKTGFIQNAIDKLPATEFKKKQYAQLFNGYALGKEPRDLLLEHGLATEEDFWDVVDRRGNVVCYQIMPKNVIHGFGHDNNMQLVDKCEHCGMERYWNYKEPYYMSENTCKQLVGMNRTSEMSGDYFDEEALKRAKKNGISMEVTLEPWYIVNKDVYNLLHAHYPRMQFIPIFAKETKD